MNTAVYLWLGLVIFFVLAEITTVNLVSVWFIAGALGALVAALLGGSFVLQLVIFFVISAVLLLLLRPLAKKYFTPKITKTNADRLIGKEALVTERIDNLRETGAIKIGGVEWSARSKDGQPIDAGTRIRILSIEGAKVCVAPAEETVTV